MVSLWLNIHLPFTLPTAHGAILPWGAWAALAEPITKEGEPCVSVLTDHPGDSNCEAAQHHETAQHQ